jgi:large subunit ribosomal protein L24
MKVKTGDEVVVLLGKDKGKKGNIERVFPKFNKVLVSGVNIYKRHKKPQGRTLQGGIIDITKPVSTSSVALVCPKCNLPTKVGFKLENKDKKRICKKCKQVIDKKG